MLSRVLIALVLASMVRTATGQPSIVGTAMAEEAFPRGQLAATVTPERYSLTLEIDPAQPEFSGEVEIALRINQATQRSRCASGTMAEAFAQCRSRHRGHRGPPHWEEDADQREVAEDAVIELLPAYEFDQRVSW